VSVQLKEEKPTMRRFATFRVMATALSKQLVVVLFLSAASTATAVVVRYDEMAYERFSSVNIDTRLYSSASDVLFERYIVKDPLGPETISDDRSSVDTEIIEGDSLVTARAHLGTSPGPGSSIRAKAQTEFYRSRVYAESLRTGTYYDDDDVYYAQNRNILSTVSSWIDEWVFNVDGWVEVEVSFDAFITLNGFGAGVNEFAVTPSAGSINNLALYGLDTADTDQWRFNLDANFGVFDQDVLVEYPDEDSDEPQPMNVGSVRVLATTAFEVLPNGQGVILSQDQLDLEAGDDITIDRTEIVRFYAIAGHSYHVVNDVRADSENGVMVDAFNTMALQTVRIEPGMVLQSRAVQDLGATLNVQVIPEVGSFWLIAAPAALMLLRRRASRSNGLVAPAL
jgi:hypothetical protein